MEGSTYTRRNHMYYKAYFIPAYFIPTYFDPLHILYHQHADSQHPIYFFRLEDCICSTTFLDSFVL